MKKSVCITAIFMFLIAQSVFCQDSLKFKGNSWSTEVNINPLNGSFSLNNANGQIKLRKFYDDNKALRLAITLGYKKNSSKSDNPYGTSPSTSKDVAQSTTAIINLGNEKHFPGSRRLSPYIGYEAGIGLKVSTEKYNSGNVDRTTKGAWQVYSTGYPSYLTYTERGFWSIGVNAITGFDFYVSKGLYVGAEIAFGINYLQYSKIKIEDKSVETTYPEQSDSSWQLGPAIVNGIRIGYIF
jgi:hypothetical protein